MAKRLNPRFFPDYSTKSVIDEHRTCLIAMAFPDDNLLHLRRSVRSRQRQPRALEFQRWLLPTKVARSRIW